jgi:GNAT superfamily N-acetyltransferase
MIHLTPRQTATLQSWFLPERPGPLVGPHVINTGQGCCWTDRWPGPRALLVETAGNYSLLGDASALSPADLQPHLQGFVEAPEGFVPLLRAAFPDLVIWPRVIYTQPSTLDPPPPNNLSLRRLTPCDAQSLVNLDPDLAWISKTWGGPGGLAESGYAWGAWAEGQLASVACTFFLGQTYEDIGVVTEPGFRGQGLSTACVGALCQDIWARGRQPSWTTSADNVASQRVAEKLGFSLRRVDMLYVIGLETPRPA